MATLPFIADTRIANTPYMAPDISFLQGQVGRANQQYKQGLQEIQSDYSAILNADITDEANKVKRQEYVQQVNEGMKKISSLDVSDPKVMLQAEQLMSPFWQDTFLLQDISKTKRYNAQVQKAYSARDSKDENVRATFDPRSVELLNLEINRLRTANRNQDEYKDIEIDDWTPAPPDVANTLTAIKDTDKFGVTTEYADGYGNIIKQTNGVSSIPAFKNFADAHIGTQYEAHYKMLGKLEKERQINHFQTLYPGATRQQASEAMFSDVHKEITNTYARRVDDYNFNIDTQQALLNKIDKAISEQPDQQPSPTQAANRRALEADIQRLSAGRTAVESTYRKLLSEDGRRTTIQYPENAFAQMQRTYDITKWADEAALNTEYAIRKDESYWSAQTLNKEYAQLKETYRHNVAEEGIQGYNAQTGRFNAQTSRISTDIAAQRLHAEFPFSFNPDGTFNLMGNALHATPAGTAVEELLHINAVDQANAKRALLQNTVVGSVYGDNGLATNVLLNASDKQVSNSDITGFRDVMQRFMNGEITEEKQQDGTYRYKGMSPEQGTALSRVGSFLTKNGFPNQSLDQTHKAMLGYVGKYVSDTKNVDALNPTEFQNIQRNYKNMKDYADALEMDNREREVNIGRELRSSNAFNAINREGRVINESDIIRENQLPETIHLRTEDGKDVTMPAAKVAKDILSAPFNYYENTAIVPRALRQGDVRGAVIVGGKYYTITNDTDHKAFQRIASNIGVSNNNLLEQKKNLYTKALQGTHLYSDVGKVGTGYFVPLGEKEVGSRALREDVQPGQFNQMYVMNTTETAATPPEPLKPELQQLVKNIANTPDPSKYLGANYKYITSSHTGAPGVLLSFRDDISKPSGLGSDIYKELRGKQVFVEFSGTHGRGSTYNRMYPQAVPWSPLAREGSKISSDPTENAIYGGSYNIENTGNSYILSGYLPVFNSTTGQTTQQRVYMPLSVDDHIPTNVIQTTRDYWNNNATKYMNDTATYNKVKASKR